MPAPNLRMAVVEGSPDQLAEFAKLMGFSGGGTLTAAAPTSEPAPVADALIGADGRPVVTKDFAKLVLSRRPLAPEQRAFFKLLAEAYPKQILATDVQAAVNYTPQQFAGLMGAFGRRTTYTNGYNPNAWFVLTDWDHSVGCYRYSIPHTVKEALDELRLS